MKSRVLGRSGEDYVCGYLFQKGYKVVARNYRTKYFEIDIIATKGDVIGFFEVKTRSSFEVYEHTKSIGNYKLLKIKLGAQAFLTSNPEYQDYQKEIKAIIVLVNPYSGHNKVVFYEYLD